MEPWTVLEQFPLYIEIINTSNITFYKKWILFILQEHLTNIKYLYKSFELLTLIWKRLRIYCNKVAYIYKRNLVGMESQIVFYILYEYNFF